MDYIIFREKTCEFMRWTDGKIYVSGDEDDIKEQFETEKADGSEPVIFKLDYDGHYFDSEGQGHQKVRVYEGEQELIGFSYKISLDDTDDFVAELEEWGKELEKEEKADKGLLPKKSYKVTFSFHTYGTVYVEASSEEEALELADPDEIDNHELLMNMQEDNDPEAYEV